MECPIDSPTPGGESSLARRRWSVVAAVAVVAGVALRVAAARGDLWLDEIWSLRLVAEAGSVAGVFTRIHHDNNHHLNSLYLLLVDGHASPLALRLLAIVAGAGTLLTVALRPLRYGRLEAATTAVLLAACPLLVHYDSEARGYAPAVLGAVGGFHTLDRHLARRSVASAALVAGCTVLGLLAHSTFLFPLAGLVAWAVVDTVRTRPPLPQAGLTAAAFLVPGVLLVTLWAVDLRHVVIGGGPPADLTGVLRDLVRGIHGLPHGPGELLAAPLVAVALWALARLARAGDARVAFFVTTVAVAPAAALLLWRPEYLAPRYFLVGVPFVLVLASLGLCEIARRGARGRAVHAIALAAFCVASAAPLGRLVRDGRGHYAEAVAYLAARTPGSDVTIATDHDFRNGLVLAFHAERAGLAKRFLLARWGDPGVPPPLWFLRHDFRDPPVVPPEVWSPAGHRYVHAASFPYAGLSGWHWLLYRRADTRPLPPAAAPGGGVVR